MEKDGDPLKKILQILAAAAFWIAVWALLAAAAAQPLLLPAPGAVVRRLAALAVTRPFWLTVAATLLRILCGIAAGTLLGTLLAAATSRFRILNALVAPLLTVIKSTPVASFIVLIILWIGRSLLPSVIVVLIVVPVVWANVSAGIAGTDRALLELAAICRFPRGRILRRIYFPSVLPDFLAALRSVLGLAWKAGVTAEVLTSPGWSVGRMLMESKLYLEIPDMFAWTLVVILCSLAIEKLLIAAIARLGKSAAKGGSAA